MADIKKITLPSGDEYDIKDEVARELAKDKQDAATSGTLTFNATSYNSQYVESLSGSWQRIGNIVVFEVTYKMKAAISSSLTHVVTNMPQCDGIIHFLSESAVNEVAARHVSVNGTSLFLGGAHTAGKTYYAGGAYLTK